MNYSDILLKHFPDAVLITEGLDKGKYETADWLFHLECGFFCRKIDRNSRFVAPHWNGELAWDNALFELIKDNKADLFCKQVQKSQYDFKCLSGGIAYSNTPIVKAVG